tara:strand:+ start:75519 stop:76034 length:516 start_codon:yes stop_codon:yes gene_type:complete
MNYNNIPNGLLINSQVNLNPKVYFGTLVELADLGTADVLAYTYYKGMLVYCEEDKNWYVWRELQTPSDATGVVGVNYTYPASYVSFGITYSSLVYNFFPIHNAKTITPHGDINIKKISTSTTDEVIEAGDYVVNTVLTNDDFLQFGIYVSGDPLIEASYDAITIQILKPTS